MKIERMLPEVYIRESRDFAYIARLIEIIFNYMKSSGDCIKSISQISDTDTNLISLLATNVGFDTKHIYSNKNLLSVLKSFSEILRNKGNSKSIQQSIQLLLNNQKIKNVNIQNLILIDNATGEIEIQIPENLEDTVLLEDIFDYILPAGMTYKFTKLSITDSGKNITSINIADTAEITMVSDLETAKVNVKENISNIHLGTIYTGTTVAYTDNNEE